MDRGPGAEADPGSVKRGGGAGIQIPPPPGSATAGGK